MNVIQLSNGKYFSLIDPNPEVITLEVIAHMLARTNRFNGATKEPYCVAEHSIWCSELVPPKYRWDALMHDAHEIITGDLISPVKCAIPALQGFENRIASAVRKHFKVSDPLPLEVHEADLIMLATERRDLMPENQLPWPCLEGIDAHDGFDLRSPKSAMTAELALFDLLEIYYPGELPQEACQA